MWAWIFVCELLFGAALFFIEVWDLRGKGKPQVEEDPWIESIDEDSSKPVWPDLKLQQVAWPYRGRSLEPARCKLVPLPLFSWLTVPPFLYPNSTITTSIPEKPVGRNLLKGKRREERRGNHRLRRMKTRPQVLKTRPQKSRFFLRAVARSPQTVLQRGFSRWW